MVKQSKRLFDMSDETSEMKKLMGKAIWNALAKHKKLGEPVAVWQDGQVVTLSAEDIPTQEDIPTHLEDSL